MENFTPVIALHDGHITQNELMMVALVLVILVLAFLAINNRPWR